MEYKLSEIAAVCGARFEGVDSVAHTAITDSRTALAGTGHLFFAIAGVNHDAHAHIGGLYARGVRGFVVERPVDASLYPEAGFVHAASTVGALQTLAAHHRAGFRGRVVGITGSNGKTVVKEWAAQLAPEGVRLVRSPKSYNSQTGVPLSVLMIRGDEDVAIIEAGISRPGEMELLERIVRPEIGIITTIGDAHSEGFGSLEQKLDEKIALFRGARKIIYNSAYPLVSARLRALCPSAELIDAAGCKAAYTFFAERAAQENAASALALWEALGYPAAQTATRLPLLQPVAMRLELREGIAGAQVINDSYNSDINSLGIALDYQQGVAGGRPRTLVISDILQSGMDDAQLYAQVAAMAAARGVDLVIGIGSRIGQHVALFGDRSEFYPTTESFLERFDQRSLAGHSILIKGNRSSRFELLSHALSLHTHTTTLEVDLDAMASNLSYLRSRPGQPTRVMAMIKAFAYGNGGYEVASMLERQGVDYLAVAFADEGAALRARGITAPIVVLNADQDSFELMIQNGLEPEIYSFASLAAFRAALARHSESAYPIHIKLDTGMHRLGFTEADMPRLAAALAGDGLVRVATVFSHLAASDEPAQDDFTRGQIALFTRLAGVVSQAGGYPGVRPGPGVLLANMGAEDIARQVTAAIVRVPHAAGLN
ncbi:MAG: alanine racemase, partial [Rikenellaceae bacterium]|nr:alanine racemase [Rikenellaceae bacterium]